MPWCAAKLGAVQHVYCVLFTRPALLGVAHVGEAAQEAAAWVADAAQRLHNERDERMTLLELLA